MVGLAGLSVGVPVVDGVKCRCQWMPRLDRGVCGFAMPLWGFGVIYLVVESVSLEKEVGGVPFCRCVCVVLVEAAQGRAWRRAGLVAGLFWLGR